MFNRRILAVLVCSLVFLAGIEQEKAGEIPDAIYREGRCPTAVPKAGPYVPYG